VSIEGTPYLVLRISGLAFVLHQIRHMVGTALAVTLGAVPRDAMLTALSTPLQVDVSPLAPGCGLLLDEIRWFDVGRGKEEATVPPQVLTEMGSFKEKVIYPHIHSLYQDGSLDKFVNFITAPDPAERYLRYNDDDYERLRRVRAHWDEYVAGMVLARREVEQARRAEKIAAGEAERARKRELPGGLMVALCVRRGIVPGAESFALMQRLQAQAQSGKLLLDQRHDYYLDALDALDAEDA